MRLGRTHRRSPHEDAEDGRMPAETGLAAISSPGKHPLQGSQHSFLSRPSRPLEGCFAAMQPLESALGLCRDRSVTHLSRRDDVNAAVADLMIKGALHVCPPEADYETFLFCDSRKPGATLQGDVNRGTPPPRSFCRDRLAILWAVAFLPPVLSLLP